MARPAEAAQPGRAGWLARLPVRPPGVVEAVCWLAAAGLLAATVGWPSLGGSHYAEIERQAASALARRAQPAPAGPEVVPAMRLSASAAP